MFQRRTSATDFYRSWQEYEEGFGAADENCWLGNARLAAISATGAHELRVDMGYGGARYCAAHAQFALSNAATFYTLNVGGYSGNAGDGLRNQNGMAFTTFDADHDSYSGNCAVLYRGGWWYKMCHTANLNGLYGSTEYAKMTWASLAGHAASVALSEMKVRER